MWKWKTQTKTKNFLCLALGREYKMSLYGLETKRDDKLYIYVFKNSF